MTVILKVRPLRPLRLCERYSEIWLRLCRAGRFVVKRMGAFDELIKSPTLIDGLQPKGNSVPLQFNVILLPDLGVLSIIADFERGAGWIIAARRPDGIVLSLRIRAEWSTHPSFECKLSQRTFSRIEVLMELIGTWCDDAIGFDVDLLAFLRMALVARLEHKLISSAIDNHDMGAGIVPVRGDVGTFAIFKYV